MARSYPQDRHSQRELSGFAGFLGARVAALRWDDLPREAVQWAKVGILDTVGVTLAGSREDAPRLLASALDPAPGPSLIFGTSRRVGVLDAAYVNGTASHALDFDDCSNTMGGHPSVPVLSALFPLADELGVSGCDFVLAYIAGFEVETKIALAVNFHHYTKGWHPTATLGTFGASLHQGLASDRHARHLRRSRGGRAADGTGCGQNEHRARARGVVRIGHQGELRHHGEAAARRP